MSLLNTIGNALGTAVSGTLGGALLSGIGSLGASLFGNHASTKASKELMDYQYQLQQQAIDKANLYNSPKEQMKRLAEAQLNPNLVYGSGVDGNQSSAASPSVVNASRSIDNPLQGLEKAYYDNRSLQMMEIKNRNEAFESRSRRLLNEARTLGQLISNRFNSDTLKTRVQHAAQKLANDIGRGGVIEQQSNNLRVQANVLVEQADLLASKRGLTQQQALTEIVKRKALTKGLQLTQAQINKIAEEIEYIRKGGALRGLEYDIKETESLAGDELNNWLKDHPGWEMAKDIFDYVTDKINGHSRKGRSSRTKKRKR